MKKQSKPSKLEAQRPLCYTVLLGVMAWIKHFRPHAYSPHANENPGGLARSLYPSFSALLEAAEKCPQCRDYWDRKLPGRIHVALDQWKREGRPIVKWPEIKAPLESYRIPWLSRLSSYFKSVLTPNAAGELQPPPNNQK